MKEAASASHIYQQILSHNFSLLAHISNIFSVTFYRQLFSQRTKVGERLRGMFGPTEAAVQMMLASFGAIFSFRSKTQNLFGLL